MYSERILKSGAVALLLAWTVISIYPLFFLAITSFKTDPQILQNPFSLPLPPEVQNFVAVVVGTPTSHSIFVYFFNSVIVTCGTLGLLLAVSSMAGYALARGNFPGNQAAQQFFLLSLAVPAHVLVVPIYTFFGELGLRNNLFGMILLYTSIGLPFTTILMRAYFVSFPREIEEAARIDGCSRLGTFWRVVVPVSKGALASMAIINVGWIWSELFFGLTLLERSSVRTLPLVVASYQGDDQATETVIGKYFAIMCISVLPLMLIYTLFQNQIRKGMTAGAIK
jgi:raffinose/stachyose/melibiose transport system permease protein